MPESTDGRFTAAITHLNLIRRNAAEYVRLAFTYGLSVSQIARESGLSVTVVRHMLTGGEG